MVKKTLSDILQERMSGKSSRPSKKGARNEDLIVENMDNSLREFSQIRKRNNSELKNGRLLIEDEA